MNKQLTLLCLAGLVTAMNFAGPQHPHKITVNNQAPFGQKACIAFGAGVGTYGAYRAGMSRYPRPVKALGVLTAGAFGVGAMITADAQYKPRLLTHNRLATAQQTLQNMQSQSFWKTRFATAQTTATSKWYTTKLWFANIFKKN